MNRFERYFVKLALIQAAFFPVAFGIWFYFSTSAYLAGPSDGDLYAHSWSFQALNAGAFYLPPWIAGLATLLLVEWLALRRWEKKQVKALGLLLLSLMFGAGCIPLPFPHTSERFPSMRGRVVDATTGQPIPKVKISIHDHPSTTTKTDETGTFHFSTYRNYHYGFLPGICGTSWPEGTSWSSVINLSHPAYESAEIQAGKFRLKPGTDKPLRDIPLQPKTP